MNSAPGGYLGLPSIGQPQIQGLRTPVSKSFSHFGVRTGVLGVTCNVCVVHGWVLVCLCVPVCAPLCTQVCVYSQEPYPWSVLGLG